MSMLPCGTVKKAEEIISALGRTLRSGAEGNNITECWVSKMEDPKDGMAAEVLLCTVFLYRYGSVLCSPLLWSERCLILHCRMAIHRLYMAGCHSMAFL